MVQAIAECSDRGGFLARPMMWRVGTLVWMVALMWTWSGVLAVMGADSARAVLKRADSGLSVEGLLDWQGGRFSFKPEGTASQVAGPIRLEEFQTLRLVRGQAALVELGAGEQVGLKFTARLRDAHGVSGPVVEPVRAVHSTVSFLDSQATPLQAFLNHSLTWEAQLVPARSGLHTFHLSSSVRGSLWIDREWVCGLRGVSNEVVEVSGQIPLEAGRRHEVVIALENDGRMPQCRLEWESKEQPREVIPAGRWVHRQEQALARKLEHGVLATYFGNPDFQGARVIRIEPIPSGHWGTNAPFMGRGVPGRFSVTYSGMFFPPENGDYSFYLDMEGGGRLTVAAQVQYEWWTDERTSVGTLAYPLEGGKANTFLLEYFNQKGPAKVIFRLFRRSEGFLGLLPEWFKPASPPLEDGRPVRVLSESKKTDQEGGMPRTSPSGVLLVDGSVLAQLPLSASAREMRFEKGKLVGNVSLGNVAVVRWMTSAEPIEKVPDFRGARLANGEVVEGDFQELDDAELKLGSVLFGNRGVERERLESLVLRSLQKARPRWYVHLVEGSRIGGAGVELEGRELRIQSMVVGTIRVPMEQVLALEQVTK